MILFLVILANYNKSATYSFNDFFFKYDFDVVDDLSFDFELDNYIFYLVFLNDYLYFDIDGD